MSVLRQEDDRTSQSLWPKRIGELVLVPFLPLALRGDEVAVMRSRQGLRRCGVFVALFALLAGCSGPGPQLPQPRPVVIYSGARLRADYDRMVDIHEWFVREQTNIVEDPSFLVVSTPAAREPYLWEGHRLSADTVWTAVDPRAPEAHAVHLSYAHLKLMHRMDRLDEWLPEAVGSAGYALERAIIARCAEAWVLARTVFGASPYGPLDELAYSHEADHLDAFIFTARPSEFASERTEWARANPEAMTVYREWFLETFNREPPGLRTN